MKLWDMNFSDRIIHGSAWLGIREYNVYGSQLVETRKQEETVDWSQTVTCFFPSESKSNITFSILFQVMTAQ